MKRTTRRHPAVLALSMLALTLIAPWGAGRTGPAHGNPPPSKGTLIPNSTSVSCTSTARACPRTTSKPTSGLTWQPHDLQVR